MRAMVVVFFFSRASVLSVRMSSFVQGWRFTAARVAMQPCELRRARSIWLRCIHDSARITLCAPCADNCTRDEGRPFEVDNQVLISSHRELLSSKAMVVNVAEKSEQDSGRHD